LLLRVMAKLLDIIVIAAAAGLAPKVGFLAGLAYLLIGDGLFDGRSLGKKIMRLRVVTADSGVSGGFRASMIRNAPFAAAMLLFNIPFAGWIFPAFVLVFEFLLALGNGDGMRLGDDFAGTRVLEG